MGVGFQHQNNGDITTRSIGEGNSGILTQQRPDHFIPNTTGQRRIGAQRMAIRVNQVTLFCKWCGYSSTN